MRGWSWGPQRGGAVRHGQHWMFDRGLLAIDDDLRILAVSCGLPDDAARLLVPDRMLRRSDDPALRPHQHFLRWHREDVFKGSCSQSLLDDFQPMQPTERVAGYDAIVGKRSEAEYACVDFEPRDFGTAPRVPQSESIVTGGRD